MLKNSINLSHVCLFLFLPVLLSEKTSATQASTSAASTASRCCCGRLPRRSSRKCWRPWRKARCARWSGGSDEKRGKNCRWRERNCKKRSRESRLFDGFVWFLWQSFVFVSNLWFWEAMERLVLLDVVMKDQFEEVIKRQHNRKHFSPPAHVDTCPA